MLYALVRRGEGERALALGQDRRISNDGQARLRAAVPVR